MKEWNDADAADVLGLDVAAYPPPPPAACLSPNLTSAQNDEVMHALSDYMRFMVGPRRESHSAADTLAWLSLTSLETASVGPSESPGSSFCQVWSERAERSGPDPTLATTLAALEDVEEEEEDPGLGVGSASIIVKGLPPQVEKLGLYELVGPLGAVLKLESLLDAETRTRTAIVRFRSGAEARVARSRLDGAALDGFLLSAAVF
jgi:hypothetical protein